MTMMLFLILKGDRHTRSGIFQGNFQEDWTQQKIASSSSWITISSEFMSGAGAPSRTGTEGGALKDRGLEARRLAIGGCCWIGGGGAKAFIFVCPCEVWEYCAGGAGATALVLACTGAGGGVCCGFRRSEGGGGALALVLAWADVAGGAGELVLWRWGG